MQQQLIVNNIGRRMHELFASVVQQAATVFANGYDQTTVRHVIATKLNADLERKLVVTCTNEGDVGIDGPRSVLAQIVYSAVGEQKLVQYQMTYDVASGEMKDTWSFRTEIPDMADCLLFLDELDGIFVGVSFTGITDHQTVINK